MRDHGERKPDAEENGEEEVEEEEDQKDEYCSREKRMGGISVIWIYLRWVFANCICSARN